MSLDVKCKADEPAANKTTLVAKSGGKKTMNKDGKNEKGDRTGKLYVTDVTFNAARNEFIIKGVSSSGCPIASIGNMTRFIKNNKVPFSIAFILIGFFFTYFG